LSGAYPTAMAMIGVPDWSQLRERQEQDYWQTVKATDLAYFYIKFKFNYDVRFPIFTVRTASGLLFPTVGEAYCCAPEIVAARKLGCQIEVIRAIELPANRDDLFFTKFHRLCADKRKKAEENKNRLESTFWKEISNSSYGKLAQGLKKKKTFNIKENGMMDLPPCKITNPFFAAYTTSFVRATLGEIMNALPPYVSVSNCTTDGFLCTASEEEIKTCLNGDLAQLYKQHRALVLGKSDIDFGDFLKVKHRIKQLLGWRTRGQATLQSYGNNEIVLAKAGIRTSRELITDEEQNQWIVKAFINREPDTTFKIDYSPSIREMVSEIGSDLVILRDDGAKSLAMEFDLKRRPTRKSIITRPIMGIDHVFYRTVPWKNVNEFNFYKKKWKSYTKDSRVVIKTEEDIRKFIDYVNSSSTKVRTSKTEPEKDAIRVELCTAFAQKLLGFDKLKKNFRRKEFAEWLTNHGVETNHYDIENNKDRKFTTKRFERSEFTTAIISALKKELLLSLNESLIWKSNTVVDSD